MKTREEAIAFCKGFPDVYEDYPFHDQNWTVMRYEKNRKSFAFIYERQGAVWINVKCPPDWIEFWRNAFTGVVPAYHMNKKYWNSIILDGSIPDSEEKRMISESYDLVTGGR
ncbi:MmcQ/YjbR family DNA-binding protein [Diplocloster hominis]|uniref:MmcQ/YjbR family DNA-binding protein n=1 Tax=Diplocloster hominis TaxID=3079010 RepID=UPI0031BA2C9E